MAAIDLWLLRHGDAEPHGSAPDFERALTPKGEAQARNAGAALAALDVTPAACYTSPKVRARDTAQLACEALGVEPEPVDAVAGDFDTDDLRDLLLGHEGGQCVLVVGHEPDFSQLAYDLTGARADVKKGGLVHIAVQERRGELLGLFRPVEIARMVDR